MPFTVPNATDLVAGTIRSLDQAEPDSLDFQAVGNRRNGVVSGADVSSVSSAAGNPTPAYLNVTLSACEVVIDGVYGRITSNLTAVIPAAPAGADTRFDVICAYNNGGTFQLDVVGGAASSNNPIFPTIPSSKIPLYAVYVKSGENSVDPAELLTDKRVLSLSSTVRTGTGDPAGSLGSIGDLYLDTVAQAVDTRSGLWVKTGATTWRRLAAYGELTGDVTTVGTAATIVNSAVTASKIATSVAGNGLSGGGGTALAVNVDGTTIEISSDILRIRDGGVGTSKVVSGGNYPINISGNAATATSATSATSATNATNATNATLASKSSTLAQNGGNGAAMTFNWSGQAGQPSYLWGSNDGTNVYVWNPSNFSVNYATTSAYSTYWWAQSHVGSYYLVNNWDGSRWNLTSNHGAGVRVSYADSANSASSASQLYSGPAYNATIAHNGSWWDFSGTNSGISTNGGITAATTIYAPNVNANTCFSGNYHEFPTYNAGGSGIALIHNSSGQIRRTSSRRHLKNSINDFSNGIDIIKLLRPRTFYWNVADDDGAGDIYYKTQQTSHGFIVEEVEEVLPDLVHFDVAENGTKTPVMWKQIDVISILVKAVQELAEEVEALKAAK